MSDSEEQYYLICYLCKKEIPHENFFGYTTPEDYEGEEELNFCNDCFTKCDICDVFIENPDELIYLIDKYNSLNTCIKCLLNKYENAKHCQCCKCLENNNNININEILENKKKEFNLYKEEQENKYNSLYNNFINLKNENKTNKIENPIEYSNSKKKIKKNKKSDPEKKKIRNNKNKFKSVVNKVLLLINIDKNCKYLKEQKIQQQKINAKNKLMFHIKNISKKIIIINRFIKELNIKKDYNKSIKKLFDKIIYNINKKINIKIINPKNEIESLFQLNIESKYNEIDSQSKMGELFIKENIKNKTDLKKYIKINDNIYINTLLNNEDRIGRYIKYNKRIYQLNKYINIDTIIYSRFLNDIRDIQDDMFFKLIDMLDKYNKNKDFRKQP